MIWSRCFSLVLKITAALTTVAWEGLLSHLLVFYQSWIKLYSSMSSFFLLGGFQEMSMDNAFPQNIILMRIGLVTG